MAAECLAAAKQTFDAGVRASLVEMAQKWLDFAERSEYDGRNEALRLRALGAAIGQDLRDLYAPPEHMPHRLLTLLMQLDAQGETD
jgi:hypothetical protein